MLTNYPTLFPSIVIQTICVGIAILVLSSMLRRLIIHFLKRDISVSRTAYTPLERIGKSNPHDSI